MALYSSGVCPKLSDLLAISNSKLSLILLGELATDVPLPSINSVLPLSFKSSRNVSVSMLSLSLLLSSRNTSTSFGVNSVLPILATKSAMSLAVWFLILKLGNSILLLNLGIAWSLAKSNSFCPLPILERLSTPVNVSAACLKPTLPNPSDISIFLDSAIALINCGEVFSFCLPAVTEGSPLLSDCLNTAWAIPSVKVLKSFLVKSFLASTIEKVLPLLASTNFFLPASFILLLCTAISLAETVVATGSNKDWPISNAAELLTLPCR